MGLANNNSKENNTNNSNKQKNDDHPVQVFLRVRPLIAEEEGHELIEYKRHANNTNNNGHQFQVKLNSNSDSTPLKTFNPAFASAPPLRRHRGDEWKQFEGFTNILQDDCNNKDVYQATVQPLVSRIANQNTQSACVFTYGHTGSGKSHTLLGYDNELGVYKFAAADLLEKLQAEDDCNSQRCLLVRVTELYKDNARDLLTGESCSIRQDGHGVVQVRGPMVEDEEGKIHQQPLGELCSTAKQVIDCVEAACERRRVGTSTHHSQSSRSHLVLELEVVTPELVEYRNLWTTQDAQITRLKWLQTERLRRHTDRPLPQWTQEYNNNATKLRKDIQHYEALVKGTKRAVMKLERTLGGTLVFCDLAGNEYARDAATSTQEELEEAAEINKSLLAVKEMLRSLQQQSHHIPYRDSKLTMMLRRHLDNKAVMLAHISPSQESLKKTINTLNYSALMVSPKQKNKVRMDGKAKKKENVNKAIVGGI